MIRQVVTFFFVFSYDGLSEDESKAWYHGFIPPTRTRELFDVPRIKHPVDLKELQAIQECQSGRLERFDDLYRQYIDRIYRFIYFKTFHRETAEDITSDVFMKVLERINQFDPTKGTFSSWLYRVARNTVIDHYRTTHPTEEIEDGWILASSTNIEHDAEVNASLEKVQQALGMLKPEQREVVVMRLWDGLSHQEIADILGMTESNTKQIFSRTIRKLREDYGGVFILSLMLIRFIHL